MGRNAGIGKVAYSWISPDPAKAGPTLGVVVGVKHILKWKKMKWNPSNIKVIYCLIGKQYLMLLISVPKLVSEYTITTKQ